MKKRKQWHRRLWTGGVIMAAIAAMTGCVKDQDTYEKQAKAMLEEKYGTEFTIEKYLGHEWISDEYKVTAYAKENQEVLIQAKVACDGTWIEDDYVTAMICNQIQEQVEENLKPLMGYKQIRVEALSDSIDSANADMSIEEYMSIKTKNRFSVYLVYCPEGAAAETIDNTVTGAMKGLETINGNIQLYQTDEETVKSVQKYFAEHETLYDSFDELLGRAEPVVYDVKQGIVTKR